MRRLLAVVLLLPVAAVTAADPPKDEKLPVAVVNLEKVMFESEPAKAVISELKAFVEKREKEIKDKEGAAAKIRKELADKDKTLTPEQKADLTKKADALENEIGKISADTQRHAQKLQRNAVPQLKKEADRLLKEYAKERGILVVFDTSNEAPNLIVVNEAADITEELLKRMAKFKVQPPEEVKDPKPQVLLETSLGDIVLELDRVEAPITVANFLQYVDDKHYDGTIFHRVMGNFMIQGGGFNEKLEEKPTRKPITNEATNGLKNVRGSIAMARTDEINSATAQFFINVVDNPKLDHQNQLEFGYAVFGKVIKGMEVVDKIKEVKTGVKNGMKNVPLEVVIIKSAKRVTKPAEKPEK